MFEIRTAIVLFVALVLGSGVQADPLLNNDDDTLTYLLMGGRTPVQGVLPGIHDRGVGLGGYERLPANFMLKVAADPAADLWNTRDMMGAMRLSTGTYVVTEIDLAFPSPGFSWQISRSFNARQFTDGGTRDSNGYQGKNWFQNSQPELVVHDDDGSPSTRELEDRIYLVYRADAFIEFARVEDDSSQPSDTFRAVNGAAGAMLYEAGTGGDPDTYTYYDAHGASAVFFGDNTASSKADWQLWKLTSPGGHTAYIGHETSPTSAVTNGYDASGRITTVYDTADRRITYTYATHGGAQRLESVVFEINKDDTATWATTTDILEIGRVEYEYIDSDSEPNGSAGDLKYAVVSRPPSGANPDAAPMMQWTYYRYYDEDYSVSGVGHKHLLKMVLEPQDSARFDWEESGTGEPEIDLGWETATDAALKPYATRYFEYEDDDPLNGEIRRIVLAYTDGECGCSGNPSATYNFSYGTNGSYVDGIGYDTEWSHRTVMQIPGRGYQTVYFDEAGQPGSSVFTTADPSGSYTGWHGAKTVRNSDGYVIALHEANNVTGYTHSSGALTTSATEGLIKHRGRVSSGDFVGLIDEYRYQIGDSGSSSKYLTRSKTYHDFGSEATLTVGEFDIRRPLPSTIRLYRDQSTAITDPADETSFDYAFFPVDTGDPDAPLMPRQIEAEHPAVPTFENGSGLALVESFWYTADGQMQWRLSTDGRYSYWEHEYNQVVAYIPDANPANSTRFPTTGSSAVDSPVQDVSGTDTVPSVPAATMCEWNTWFDDYRYRWLTKDPEDRYSYRKWGVSKQWSPVTIDVPRVEIDDTQDPWEVTKSYGPALYTVWAFQAPKPTGDIELTVQLFHAEIVFDDGETTLEPDIWIFDPELVTGTGAIYTPEPDYIKAFTEKMEDEGETSTWLRNVVEYIPDSDGPSEIRAYWKTPSDLDSQVSLADITYFEYAGPSRQLSKITEPDGSYTEFEYDYVGAGTSAQERIQTYRGGPVGARTLVQTDLKSYYYLHPAAYLLSSRTEELGASGGDRVTEYVRDEHGRILVQKNPVAPHRVNGYNEQGVLVSWALYSSDSGLDEDSVPTDTANRIALTTDASRTLVAQGPSTPPLTGIRHGRYDLRRFKIGSSGQKLQSGGDDIYVGTQVWYDTAGRVAKSVGNQITKYEYDRHDRVTREYTVAETGDIDYDDAMSLSSDIVLEEKQVYYQGCVLPAVGQAIIQRAHDDYGTGETIGALDDNGDADRTLLSIGSDVEGRVQIEAYWYDELDRLIKVGRYGDNGGSDFDWDNITEPTGSSSTVFVTLTSHSWSKHIYSIDQTNEIGVVSRSHYDDADRLVARIDDYDDYSPLNPDPRDSGSTPGATDDRTVRYGYEDGHLVSIWTDVAGNDTSASDPYGTIDPSDSEDQVTKLVYGVLSSSSDLDSELNDPSLLYEIQHPDSSGGNDAERFAYNTLGEMIERKDQAGHTFTITLDDAGRQVAVAVDETVLGFDYTVRRIEWSYSSRGVLESVLQRGTADTSGSVLDEVKIEVDEWNQISTMHHDLNSGYTAMGDHLTVDYGFEEVAGERRLIRRTGMDYPSNLDVNYSYSSTLGSQDDEIGRPSKISLGSLAVVTYDYLGAARLARVNYPEPQVSSEIYDVSTGNYDFVDRWDRPSQTRWRRTINAANEPVFYDTSTSFDYSMRVESMDDNVFTGSTVTTVGHDYLYGHDSLGRLISSDHGLLSGSGLSRTDGAEDWTLLHSAQWVQHDLDLNGDGSYNATGEFVGEYDHSNANELIERALTNNGTTTTYTLSHDANGNLTDDDQDYEYTYDAFGRLVEVTDQSQTVVNSYTYNGLGHRISEHYDADLDGTIETDEKREYIYDDQWRIICAYRYSASIRELDEQFVYHFAGQNGSASYVDSVVLRAMPGVGQQQSSGTDRLYYCQNWRADVVALVEADGGLAEQVRYTAYGTPFNLPAGEVNGDGTTGNSDYTQIGTWISSSTYDVRGDLDLDGDVDAADQAASFAGLGTVGGRGSLSTLSSKNITGYAGYVSEGALTGELYHLRERAYVVWLGQFTQREPAIQVLQAVRGSASQYVYTEAMPLVSADPSGLVLINLLQDLVYRKGLQNTRRGKMVKMLTEVDDFLSNAWVGQCVMNGVLSLLGQLNNSGVSAGSIAKGQLCSTIKNCVKDAILMKIKKGVPGKGEKLPGLVTNPIDCIAMAPFEYLIATWCDGISHCTTMRFLQSKFASCGIAVGIDFIDKRLDGLEKMLMAIVVDSGLDQIGKAAGCGPGTVAID